MQSFCHSARARAPFVRAVAHTLHGATGCSILPGEELAIANSHEHDDEDYASFFSDSDFKPTGHTAIRERGFQGTALQTGSDYQPMDAQLQEVCT